MKAGAVLFALMLVMTACGGGDSGESSSEGGAVATADAGLGDLEFCQSAGEAAEILDQAEEFDFEEALAVLEDVADDAPSAIEDDMDLIIDGFRQFAAFMEDGTEPTIDEAELEAASARLDRYFVDVCGFEDTDAGDPGDAGAATSADTSEDVTEDIDVGMETFEGAGLTLDISGAVDASDGNYDPFFVECTLWGDGDFWLQVYPDAQQWTLEINASGVPGLETGSWDTYYASAAPPFDSEEGQSGLFLTGETGTLTIDGIGAVEDIGDGSKAAEVSGQFEVQMAAFDDPSAEVTATGTFACLAAVREF